jgi:hypothetical protein
MTKQNVAAFKVYFMVHKAFGIYYNLYGFAVQLYKKFTALQGKIYEKIESFASFTVSDVKVLLIVRIEFMFSR